MKNKTEFKGYELNEKPALKHLFPLGMQQVLLFIAGSLAVPLIIADGAGMNGEETALMVQCMILVAGIGTMLQAFGLGPIGNKLPTVLGPTFTFLAPAIAISVTYGYDVFIGASLIGGLVMAIVGGFLINHIRKLFPPLVLGCVIMVIGIALFGVGIDYIAGGFGAANYGSWQNYLVGGVTVAFVIIFNIFAKGFLKGASVLAAMVIGTVLALVLGMVDFSPLATQSWFALPQPLAFGIRFELVPILICIIIYLVNTVEFIGDTSNAALAAADRLVTPKELSKGIVCDGLASSLGAVFNVSPTVTYSANIGLLKLTGVKSRYVVGFGGLIITLLGFMPKVAQLLALTPVPVIGGASLVTFGIIATSGMELLMRSKPTSRDMLIAAVALSIGLGFYFTPAALADYPYYVSALLNGIPGTAIAATILNLLLPKSKEALQEEPLSQEADGDAMPSEDMPVTVASADPPQE